MAMNGTITINFETVRRLDTFFSQPVAYLAINGKKDSDTTETIARYLNDAGLLVQLDESYPLWLAIVPASYAQFYVDRLASGLIGAKQLDSIENAVEHLGDLVFQWL